MTTGHWNPGYENIVSNLEKSKDKYQHALPGTSNLRDIDNRSLDRFNLDEIRRNARDVWAQKDTSPTSYQNHYSDRFSKVDQFTETRPTSSQRKNKPHPSQVFLTNRLHYVPGYHNADTTLGKEVYRIDASLSPSDKERRDQLRTKFIGRPSTTAVNQYKTNEELNFIENPLERRVTEALIKVTNDENVLSDLPEIRSYSRQNHRGAFERSCRPKTVASLHRYLKQAGAEESSRLQQVYNNYMYGEDQFGARTGSVAERRLRDMQNMVNVTITNAKPTRRGDFLMHPEWSPAKPWHRLNGLSSVDVPFSYSTR